MGSGKSSVGREVARRLGLPFVDLDAELTARHGPIVAQFDRDGEAVFRAREVAIVAEICAATGPRVVATGGGTWADPVSRARLRARFDTVVLTAPVSVLRERVALGAGRPRWDADVEALLASRQAAYGDADLVVDTQHGSPEAVAADIVTWVRGRACPPT